MDTYDAYVSEEVDSECRRKRELFKARIQGTILTISLLTGLAGGCALYLALF